MILIWGSELAARGPPTAAVEAQKTVMSFAAVVRSLTLTFRRLSLTPRAGRGVGREGPMEKAVLGAWMWERAGAGFCSAGCLDGAESSEIP